MAKTQTRRNAQETWKRYDYFCSRDEVKQHAENVKTAVSTPGVKKAFAFLQQSRTSERGGKYDHAVA
jgi:hypothetical protein